MKNNNPCLQENKGESVDKLTASEAVYGFVGWITTRKEKVCAGSTEDCAVWAELTNEFCKANNLQSPRENWHQDLKHPV